MDEQTSTKPQDSSGETARGPDLLRQLRESLDPDALGLPAAGRRLPHPTQTEIADLLTQRLPEDQHISARWFRDLERLNDSAWPQHVADAYAELLHLSGNNRLAFYATVGCLPTFAGQNEVTAADRHYLDWSVRDPSYLSNSAWDMCYRNRRFRQLIPELRPGTNVMEFVLIHPRGRQIFPFLEWAAPMLNQLRAAIVAAQDDPGTLHGLERLVGDLTRDHPEVAEVWEHQPSIAIGPNGDIRHLRPHDPHAPNGLGQPVPVHLYVASPLGKPRGWRYMHVTLLDEVLPDQDPAESDEEIAAYRFWFADQSHGSTA